METRTIRYENARDLVAEAGGISAFAAKLGKAQSQVSSFAGENPSKGIGAKIARDIEHAFGKPRGWMDVPQAGVDMLEVVRRAEEPKDDVPLISWVNAGAFAEAPDLYPVGEGEKRYPRPHGCGPRTYALKVTGESMISNNPREHNYIPGTVIFVDPDVQAENGNKVIARLPGSEECTFKVLVHDAGKVFLKPLNIQYPMIPVEEELHICGVVKGSYYPE